MALQLNEAELEILELKRIFEGLWPGCQLGKGDPNKWGVTQIFLRKFEDTPVGLIETIICFAPEIRKPDGYANLGMVHENQIFAYCKTINHSAIKRNGWNEHKTGAELLRDVADRLAQAEKQIEAEAEVWYVSNFSKPASFHSFAM